MKKLQRMAGILLPLFSLSRQEADAGIGDLHALKEWIDWAASSKIGFIQLLPVNALGRSDVPSPYSAISSVALEPLYLALDDVPGMPEQPPYPLDLPAQLQPASHELVDYNRVRSYKSHALRQAWSHFRQESGYQLQREELQQWVIAEGSWLDDFSCFQVASNMYGSNDWWTWPNLPPDAIRHYCNQNETAREHKHYQQWLQWLCYKQWKSLRAHADAQGVKLMGDIPIGVSVASADVYFQREQFDMSWSGGAPPEGNFAEDPFTGKWGQNWGIPLYRWDHMKHDNFGWWSRRIRKTAEIFEMYRIDHILGFYRIYAFPWMPDRNEEFLPLSEDDAAARCEGRRPSFQSRPDWTEEDRKHNLMQGDDLLRRIMSISQGMIVIGEDLGCVPAYVRPNLSQLRIAGFKIPHWEIDSKNQIAPGYSYNPCSFATYATHDFPPISADWDTWYELTERGRKAASEGTLSHEEIFERRRVGKDCGRILNWLGDYASILPEQQVQAWGEPIKTALFSALNASNAAYSCMMWTELFDHPVRLNSPGTEGGSNWRPRIPFSAATAASMPQSAWLREIIEQSHRG